MFEFLFEALSGPAFKPATVAPPTTRQTETGKDSLNIDLNQMFLDFCSPVSQSHVGSDAPVSKPAAVVGGHPAPETGETPVAVRFRWVSLSYCPHVPFAPTGAILPLALGIIITALLLLMIGCRLRLVRHKLKKARPLSTEESDYLINGMYL